ncbi:uncharacterized protein [Eurosta solidaginis]|uniref:uncharacterized protein isoform X2 n=1 Tax=Eurosta solidaginis TaxID=178769 RepID=UPI00353139C7
MYKIGLKISLLTHQNVTDMVKNSKSGQSLLSLYQMKNKLDMDDRKRLLNIIVGNFFDSNSRKYIIRRPYHMNKLAEEIVEIFPTENKEIYYISCKAGRRTNASGILYNRFNNLNRKRLKLERTTSGEENASDKETLCSTNYISLKNKMKFMSGDESDAINLWRYVSLRVIDIRHLKDLKSILEEWPFYTQATGPKLLDFDFQKIYPEKTFHLINNWIDVRSQLCELYKDLLRDKHYGDLFGLVSKECVNENSKDCILIMLLNAVLKPTSRYVAEIDGKRVTLKTTIRDAMDSCIIHITNISDLEFT